MCAMFDGGEPLQPVATTEDAETQLMTTDAPPINWERRLYHFVVIGGWSAETWKPMTKTWQRSGFDPHWPEDYAEAAREWVRIAKEDKRNRNSATAAILAGG